MGGGGGGSQFIRPLTPAQKKKIEDAHEKERQKLTGDINAYLNDILAEFNGRDVKDTNRKLDKIEQVVGEEFEIERVLMGGSVAKHTEVDGLSDVDALMILNRQDLQGARPAKVHDVFFKILNQKLQRSEVKEIHKGTLAVTVTFNDKSQIQLLPALKSQNKVLIPSPDGASWNETKPRAFQAKLTAANSAMNKRLVPTIKLLKAAISNLPKQKQLSGYHIEALAIRAVKEYRGEKTPRALLLHILKYASNRVLTAMRDMTGQSIFVDSYLGKNGSVQRKNAAQAILGIQRRLESAKSVGQWRSVLEVES